MMKITVFSFSILGYYTATSVAGSGAKRGGSSLATKVRNGGLDCPLKHIFNVLSNVKPLEYGSFVFPYRYCAESVRSDQYERREINIEVPKPYKISP
jgi:hypothetical protein